jgi:hypothetical protein
VRSIETQTSGSGFRRKNYDDSQHYPEDRQNAAWLSTEDGFKPGIDFFAAVMFLPISEASFWQVVAVSRTSLLA